MTLAAGGGSPPATSCPAACSCSNQASRVICTRRDLAEVPASIPVNTRYLNLQENGIQVSARRQVWAGGTHGGRPLLPELLRGLWVSRPALRAIPWAFGRCCLHPSNWSLGHKRSLGKRLPASAPARWGRGHLRGLTRGTASPGPGLAPESQGLCGAPPPTAWPQAPVGITAPQRLHLENGTLGAPAQGFGARVGGFHLCRQRGTRLAPRALSLAAGARSRLGFWGRGGKWGAQGLPGLAPRARGCGSHGQLPLR